MGYGTDRTFSAQQWRVVTFAACGILIAGVGLGIVIGRLTSTQAEPPPVSASIVPDLPPPTATSPAATEGAPDEEADEPAPPLLVAAPRPAPPPAVVKASPPPERVAAAPERPSAPRHAGTKAKPARLQPDADPPANGPRWIVQLGAFQSSDHANLLVNTLAAHGQPAHVRFVQDAAGQGWFYVQTPPYRSATAAKSAAQRMAAREHLPTYLIRLPNAG